MNILVIGGMHGNEPLGIKLVSLLKEKPINNVKAIIANQKAVNLNKRFFKFDLNRSFPGSFKSTFYEYKRASEILTICNKYDLILDFHNTYCPSNNCSFIGKSTKKYLLNISSFLKLKRVIIADYDCINKYSLNCLSIEISMQDKLNNPTYWYGKINKLSQLIKLPPNQYVKKYHFVYRMTLEDKRKYSLEKESFQAFKKITRNVCKKLNLNYPAYPIFIGDKFTPYNFGGILKRLKK